MDFSDYQTHELENLHDELMEEIQELHNQIDEKALMLEAVVQELGNRDEYEDDYLQYVANR